MLEGMSYEEMFRLSQRVVHQLTAERDEARAQREATDLVYMRTVDDLKAARAEVKRLRRALLHIKNRQGRVCDNYELCDHAACRSSYAAWATAAAALEQTPASAQTGGSDAS